MPVIVAARFTKCQGLLPVGDAPEPRAARGTVERMDDKAPASRQGGASGRPFTRPGRMIRPGESGGDATPPRPSSKPRPSTALVPFDQSLEDDWDDELQEHWDGGHQPSPEPKPKATAKAKAPAKAKPTAKATPNRARRDRAPRREPPPRRTPAQREPQPTRRELTQARDDRAATEPEADAPPPDRGRVKRLLILTSVAAVLVAGLIVYARARSEPWKRSGPPATVSGWAPYWQTDSAYASFAAHPNLFSDLSLFAYEATAADVVVPYAGLRADAPEHFRAAARAAGVKLTASIVDGTAPHEMAGILATPARRDKHVQTIVEFAVKNDFDGIDLDYENFAFNDGKQTWDVTRPNWVAFVQSLAAGLHRVNRTLTVSAPPPVDYPVYDYEAIGKVVDTIRIMAYDYSTATAGPIAPIDWVRGVVDAAKKLVDPAKLVLGVPVYGYDWPAAVVGTCPGGDAGKPSRRNVSGKTAAALAQSKGVTPQWNETYGEMTFRYDEQLVGTDQFGSGVSCTVHHVVWYADARAVHDRTYIAERHDLAGVSLWSLGSEDPVAWDGIGAALADLEVWPATTVAATTRAG
jgi:spore germination protein YaaH